MAVTCSLCSRSLPEEPGTDLRTAAGRRYPVAHLNERGKICPMGSQDLSIDVAEIVRAWVAGDAWLDALELDEHQRITREYRSP